MIARPHVNVDWATSEAIEIVTVRVDDGGGRGTGGEREGVAPPERRIPLLASWSARSLSVASRSRRDECACTLRKARWIPRVRSDASALEALWSRSPLGRSPQSWVGSRPAVWSMA